MADELSDEIRLLLQGGIQRVLASFKNATIYNKEQLNTLMAFYRAMHSMSLQAGEFERLLDGVLIERPTPEPIRLVDVGAGVSDRLEQTAPAEAEVVRFPGRDVNGTRVQGTEGGSIPTREGGTPHFVLNFRRSETVDVVQQSE